MRWRARFITPGGVCPPTRSAFHAVVQDGQEYLLLVGLGAGERKAERPIVQGGNQVQP
jgi:hypothetical protein